MYSYTCIAAVLLIFLLLQGCVSYGYVPIKVSRRMHFNRSGYIGEGSLRERVPRDRKDRVAVSSRHAKKEKRKTYRFFVKKSLVIVHVPSPLGTINNRGVKFALEGRYYEAVYLFNEVIREDGKSAFACTNAGIVYEILGKNDDAFRMYGRACMIEPDNEEYRQNFLSLMTPD